MTYDLRGWVRVAASVLVVGVMACDRKGSDEPAPTARAGSRLAPAALLAANTPPTISDIPNQTIDEDGFTGNIAFTVGDVETPAGSLTVSGSSDNPTLVPTSAIVFGGSGAARTVRVIPPVNQFGSATIMISVSDGTDTTSDTFLLTVNSVNDLPFISDITDRTINEDTSTGPIGFSVGDVETPAGSLTVSGSSNNPALVPPSAIVFGGSGGSRTVTVTPPPNQFGTATITVTLSDGPGTASDTFLLTVSSVNDLPFISDIPDRTINEDTTTGAIGFSVGDVETPAGALTLSGSSNNPALVPPSAIAFGGAGGSRTVTITPPPNQFGAATITVTVSDGMATVTDTFLLNVLSVNDPPAISNISDQTILEDSQLGPLAFTVSDPDTAVGLLTLTGTSSNTTLVPNSGIVFGGAGANRTITVTPGIDRSGTTVITVMVSDGQALATDTFLLTVTPTSPVAVPAMKFRWLAVEAAALVLAATLVRRRRKPERGTGFDSM